MSEPQSPETWIESARDRLVELAGDLVRFDTTCVEPALGNGRNQESDCQAYLRDRLSALGADCQEIEPDPEALSEHPMMPAGHHWDGRAMTLARWPGRGNGRALILNGHIDVVSAEPIGDWSAPPFAGEVIGDRVVGRGISDMKGGIAAMLFALESLQALRLRPEGDVWVQLVTDEETNGMGTLALLEHQPPADAAVVPEPSHFDAWVACRGVLYGEITIQGRPGHAELPQPGPSNGGAVGAIEKLEPVLAALRELNESWRADPGWRHELLAPPVIVPTLVTGGEFIASFPRRATLAFDATYLPAGADADGYGSAARRAIREAIDSAANRDAWLAAHPLRWSWSSDYPPYEANDVDLLLQVLRQAGDAVGVPVRRAGLNAWHDAASLGRVAGIPAVSCGPGEASQAHAIDESMSITDLVTGAKFFARLIQAYCGVAREGM
jgi:acetylornithine deacetylase